MIIKGQRMYKRTKPGRFHDWQQLLERAPQEMDFELRDWMWSGLAFG